MSLEVDAEDPETEVLGKDVADLQDDIVVNDTYIQGTLKYVTGYTGYSGDPELQEGNFLALKADATSGATVTAELLGGHSGPVTLDEDMNVVIRIEDKDAQKVKFTVTKGGETITKVFGLASLVLETE